MPIVALSWPRQRLTLGLGAVLDHRYYYTLAGRTDVAVIPISGMIMKGASSPSKKTAWEPLGLSVSATPCSKLRRMVSRTFVLDINSPGGQVTGIQELANQIRLCSLSSVAIRSTPSLIR